MENNKKYTYINIYLKKKYFNLMNTLTVKWKITYRII